MEKVITVETMRQSDAYTIENYIDSKELMYKAGVGVFNSYSWKNNHKVAIICGTGNNAGDGYVLALLLEEINVSSKLFLIKNKFSEDGKYYFDKCRERNIPYCLCEEDMDFSQYSVIVDCIFGTGFKGRPRGIGEKVIEGINKSSANVISVDINSGLNGDSGIAEVAVKSDLTVSIGYFKTGHFINDAPKYIEKVINCDIDIELIGDYYLLCDKCDVDKAKRFDNYNSFKEENKTVENNPIEAISNYSKANEINVLVENMGEYSVYSEKGVTKIFKRNTI